VREVRYGASDGRIFLRVDFDEESGSLEGMEILAESPEQRMKVRLRGGAATVVEGAGEAAFRDIAELALPTQPGQANQVRLSFWQDGLPVQSVPAQGFLEIPAVNADNWAG
jgi:acetylornithine deacetylase/succinyl-diaminopimelate desuccinylase-like protein